MAQTKTNKDFHFLSWQKAKFEYFKIQLQTIDIGMGFQGINPTTTVFYSHEACPEAYLYTVTLMMTQNSVNNNNNMVCYRLQVTQSSHRTVVRSIKPQGRKYLCITDLKFVQLLYNNSQFLKKLYVYGISSNVMNLVLWIEEKLLFIF